MKVNEFKAWFDGFTEGFESKIPSAKQWKRIREMVAKIDGVSVEREYINSLLPSSRSEWSYPANLIGAYPTDMTPESTTNAMYALGKAEAQADRAGYLSFTTHV